MGSAELQGKLWGTATNDWTYIQEPLHTPLFETMLNASKLEVGMRFFDAGCGGGGASVLAFERGAAVSGLDAAEGLIEIARQRVPAGDFRVGDMQDLPFEDHRFDIVFAANSVQYTADRVASLRELKRVCVPAGRVVAGLFGPAENVAYRRIQEAVRNALPQPPPGKGPYELSAPGILEALFEEAGLRVIESGEVNCPFSYPDFETFWRGNAAAGPFQSAIAAAGKEKIRAACQEAIQAFHNDTGGFLISPNVFRYVLASA